MFKKLKGKLGKIFSKSEEIFEDSDSDENLLEISESSNESNIDFEKSVNENVSNSDDSSNSLIENEAVIVEGTEKDIDSNVLDVVDSSEKGKSEVCENEDNDKKDGFLKRFFKKKEKVSDVSDEVIENKDLESVESSDLNEKSFHTDSENNAVFNNEVREENSNVNVDKRDGSFLKKTFSKIASKTISESDFEKIWVDLEIYLLEINIAFEIVEMIEMSLREEIIGKKFNRFSLNSKIREVLIEKVSSVLKDREKSFLNLLSELLSNSRPVKIIFLGVNGTGKTTTIAKVVNFLKKHNLSSVVSCSDTFRAAATEQLEEHSKNLRFKLIKHKGGSDPAAVAFDAINHAKSKGLDVVIIDTAGRMPNNSNLMNELLKVKRVSNAELTIFVGDSVSGNDLIEQIESFDKVIGIDGVILTKVDTDERPGSIVTAAYSIEKPIFFLGTGQGYDDLAEFNSKVIAERLFYIDDSD